MEGMRRNEAPRQRVRPLSWRELSGLPPEERSEIMETTAGEVLQFLRERAVEYDNMNQLYQVVRGQDMIVRREAPEAVIEALESGEPLSIDFPPGERYSNAVVWSSKDGARGIENAYLEGYGHANGVVTVVGFRREAITDVVVLPDASRHFAGVDRSRVRSVRGELDPKDILFVSVRIPMNAFPESAMTDAEREKHEHVLDAQEEGVRAAPTFIHRGYVFIDHLQKQ